MEPLSLYLLLINAASFLLMLSDKRRAKKKRWRIPEAILMGIAAIGGSLGSWIGMYLFRHKTKHPKFTVGIPLFLIVHIALLIWLIHQT